MPKYGFDSKRIYNKHTHTHSHTHTQITNVEMLEIIIFFSLNHRNKLYHMN